MDENGQVVNWLSVRNLGIGAVVILVILGVVAIWLIFGQEPKQQLRPLLPTPTTPIQISQSEPESVTFTELNDNPLTYLNQTLLVTGDFLPLDGSDCKRTAGPDVRWSLTADNLQLDVLGFERIVRLLPAETPMTVQGVWRLYQGHYGCGKAPPRGSVWYLDAKKIIQPNPLIGEGGNSISVEIKTGELELPSIIPTSQPAGTVQVATQTPVATLPAGTVAPTPTNASQIIPTETPPLPSEITPSPTVDQSPTEVVQTITPDPNATQPSATDIATAVPTENPGSGTPTITAEPPPALATATETNGGGYPGPEGTPTPTPTATLNPYP